MFENISQNAPEGAHLERIDAMIDDMVAHHRDPEDLAEFHSWYGAEAEFAKTDLSRRQDIIQLVSEKAAFLEAIGHGDTPLGGFFAEKIAELASQYPESLNIANEEASELAA